ncbi:hypothetical protein, partial [Sphingobium indicum]|uniref:hypothetical protein n=1 Tax=Sphingobium indicum TaxID=332055 RepID=UPI0018CAA30A
EFVVAQALINAFPGEDLTPQTERAVEREVEAAEPGTMAAVRTFQRKRRPPLNFEEMGVPLGSILVHVASGETVEVIEAKKVRLRGEIVSLTKAQRIVSGAPYAVQPGRYWLYNGTSISDLYEATYPHEAGED